MKQVEIRHSRRNYVLDFLGLSVMHSSEKDVCGVTCRVYVHTEEAEIYWLAF